MKTLFAVLQDVLRRYSDQLIGFFGWFIINGLYYFFDLDGQGIYDYENWSILVCTVPINILALIILASIRSTRGFAFGIFVAIILNSIIFWILGLERGIIFYPFFSV